VTEREERKKNEKKTREVRGHEGGCAGVRERERERGRERARGKIFQEGKRERVSGRDGTRDIRVEKIKKERMGQAGKITRERQR